MIGSFWNLCRACPSMPVDKLHSEYRSTYRWHEYTGNSRPEVVRRPPVPNQFASSTEHFFSKSMEDEKPIEGPVNEPPLPRRKKCPELAYKTHEFIIGSETTAPNLRNDTNAATRARSEERGTPSRRSKSEGPPGVANGRAYPIPYENDVVGKVNGIAPVKAGESSGLFKKTISKLSTEYRLQFVWPQVRKAIKGDSNNAVDTPRKSLSMGALKSSQTNAMPTVHKKRTANEREATVYELEPLVNDVEEKKAVERHVVVSEPKVSRPCTQMLEQERQNQFLTRKENFGFKEDQGKNPDSNFDNKALVNGTGPYGIQWYKDIIELRKKAGEYKCRGWGIEIDPVLYKKQKDLWDQVSRRSSLSALSLASTVYRPITKEEKEQENNKKSSPTKQSTRGRVPGLAHLVDNKTNVDGPILPARVQTIRHHLERTTGPDVEEGALLPSPTREKLMPTIPKSKETDPYSSQRGSPKKSATSRHGSPQKGSPQKGSPKKTVKGRSQSVGPSVIDTNESPKRQIRSVNIAPTAAKIHKKTPISTPTTGERRPRPYDEDTQEKDGGISVTSYTPQPVSEIPEHIVKSPPEPTRVKSPEQIIMRSPDPVNWTVPLDTGKTFTVTQNVKDGENFSRPQSEVKASTPIERPPPAPLSAPPELAEQAKMEAWKNSDVSEQNNSGGASSSGLAKTIIVPEVRCDKPVPGSTLRCLDDPTFDTDPSIVSRNLASDVLEKARDRFDRFWGGNKEENV